MKPFFFWSSPMAYKGAESTSRPKKANRETQGNTPSEKHNKRKWELQARRYMNNMRNLLNGNEKQFTKKTKKTWPEAQNQYGYVKQ